jgi:hypothetical protein
MDAERKGLYRFPWSQTDNPGAWIEVTDRCNLVCRGCYRHRLGGDRPLEAIRADIDASKRLTNCDSITIAGGEPLIHPDLAEVVRYVSRQGMKPVLLTNGVGFTPEVASSLKHAGLAKVHFHVDSGQVRPGWEGRNEPELNALRQQYADLCRGIGGLQCGFNSTVYRSTLQYVPAIVEWARANIENVQHYSLIAYRAIPLTDEWEYAVNGRHVESSSIPNTTTEAEEISISTREMFDILARHFTPFQASAYLNGSSAPDTDKFLIVVLAGSRHGIYGCLGARTVELVQLFYHLVKGRYCAFLRSPKAGRKLFLMSFVDPVVRQAFRKYRSAVLKNPLRLFDSVYTQSIHFEQPYEILDGEVNLCEDCTNKMVYEGKLIPSCRLDEYRMLGGLLTGMPAGARHQASIVATGEEET